MPNLNTKQISDALLGNAQLVYRINLDISQPLRVQTDHVGFGSPKFEHDGNPDTNPNSVPSAQGMELSIERSASTPQNASIGYSVAVDLQNLSVSLPSKVVLIGCFSDLKLSLLSPQGHEGTFAAGLQLIMGSSRASNTVQVRNNTARHNFPGTSAANSFQFTTGYYTQVVNPGSPHHFNIVMLIEIVNQSINGHSFVYAGNVLASDKTFTVSNPFPIDQFRFGLGSANGDLYKASLLMHEVEIWFPS